MVNRALLRTHIGTCIALVNENLSKIALRSLRDVAYDECILNPFKLTRFALEVVAKVFDVAPLHGTR